MRNRQVIMKKVIWPVGILLSLAMLFFSLSIPALASSGPKTAVHAMPFATRESAVHSLSVTCSGNNCNGRDPYQTGCAQSFQPVASKSSEPLLVELEWSPICHTNWTQAYWTNGSHLSLDVTILRQAGQDGAFWFDSYWSDGSTWWANSNQVWAPHNKAIACVYASPSGLDPGLCTKPT